MRVIAGRLRGRKIKAPRGLATRPVLAKVREALFTILGDVEGLRVLDLYAGTGAIGIEALSRGAETVVFVESGAEQCRVIRENLASVGQEADIVRSDVLRALKKIKSKGMIFDLVFADPPYEKGLSKRTILAVVEGGLLSESGVIAVTVRHSEGLPDNAGTCEKVTDRRYGDTRLVIYNVKP